MRLLVISLTVICLTVSVTTADKVNTEKYIPLTEKPDTKLNAEDYPPPPPGKYGCEILCS